MNAVTITQITPPELENLIEVVLSRLLSKSLKEPETRPDKVLNIQEAAEFLGLSVNTIYGLTSKNLIPFSKPGKKLYFNRQQLIDFVNNGRQKTVQELSQEVENHLHEQGKRRLQRT